MAQLKNVTHSALNKISKPSIWVPAVLILAVVFWVLPTYAAQAPGQLGYGIKRFEESVVTTLAPTTDIRDGLKLDLAQRRVNEATYVAVHAGDSSGKAQAASLVAAIKPDNIKAGKTINDLLSQFTATYQDYTTRLNANVDKDKKPKAARAEKLRLQSTQIYTALALLRLQGPDAAQISVLAGVDTIQKNLATLADALGTAPLSSSDVSQLTKVVAAGMISKTDLDKLFSSQMDNRQFHNKLVELVNTKKIPSNMLYGLDEDLVKKLVPDKVASFEASSDFEQMQRISATIQSARPTKAQQQAIQNYLSKYKPGDVIPTGDIQSFVTPIIYGMTLAGELQTNVSTLSTTPLSSDDQAMLDSWKGSLATNQQNLGQLYQQLMTDAASRPDLHVRLMARVQEELVDAQKEGLDHLVLPPGWGEDQMAGLSEQLGVEVSADRFVAANPGTDQQLAVLTNAQKQLQSSFSGVEKNHDTIINKLNTQINEFTGTPAQVTQLKELLSTIKESQSTTITDLQTQLTGVAGLHTQLEMSIETLRGQQLVSLVELELRAASNAKDLTAATKAEIVTLLNGINNTTQGLVDGLQTRANRLDDAHATLHERLDSSLEAVRDEHTELVAYVAAQLVTGREATSQLTTTLQSVQTSLSQQATSLAGLKNDNDSLARLVDQVQTTAASQVNTLQGQIDGLKIDQQSVKDSIATLRTIQTTELGQLSDQLAHLSVLQTEAQVAVTTIGQQQTQTQSSLSGLTNNFTVLQTVLETVQNTQAGIVSDVADQKSQLDSLQTQTQAALSDLTQGQTQLAAQISGLTNNAANLSQTVGAIQTASTATQTQLNTLLANPPWSIIPAGTYATQAEFVALQTSLDAQFAAKAAALDAQFQAFQQSINAQVQQVNTAVTQLTQTTTTQNTSQQQAIDTLNTQVQTLKTQLQALSPAPGPGL